MHTGESKVALLGVEVRNNAAVACLSICVRWMKMRRLVTQPHGQQVADVARVRLKQTTHKKKSCPTLQRKGHTLVLIPKDAKQRLTEQLGRES